MKNLVLRSLAVLVFVFGALALVAATAHAQNAAPAHSQSKTRDLSAVVADLAARVAKLEGQITATDLVGTYRLSAKQTELQGGPNAAVSSYVFQGTAQLAADGTFTLTTPPENGNSLLLTFPPSLVNFVGAGGGTLIGTWSYSNGTVLINGGAAELDVAAAGKVLVGVTFGHNDGTDVLLVFSRL